MMHCHRRIRMLFPLLVVMHAFVAAMEATSAFAPNAVVCAFATTRKRATSFSIIGGQQQRQQQCHHHGVFERRIQNQQHYQDRQYQAANKKHRDSSRFVQASFDETTTSTSSASTSSPQEQGEFTFSIMENKDNAFGSLSNHELLLKAVNAAFLLTCFGYALLLILNIDHGMTRGWTQSEIAVRIPLDTWSSYEDALLEKPIATKTTINVIIYLLGDWLSQTLFQQKNVLDFDIQRTLKNGLIGLCFGPLVHQYYEFSDAILPVEGGLANRASKILMDQTLYLTIKCSLYITAVGLLSGEDWPTVKSSVKNKIGPVVITAWKFWPLVHCITYGLVPARHRILWVNCVDLVWNAILASKAQGDDGAPQEEDEGGEDAAGAVSEQDAVVALQQCNDDAKLIEMIATMSTATMTTTETDTQVAFEATIQSELEKETTSLLPAATDLVLDGIAFNASYTNRTNALITPVIRTR